MKKILLLVMGVLLITSYVHAETIYLKDGRVIKGKILEKGNYYIKVMEGRFPRQYFNEQIEKIMEDEEPLKYDPSQIDANGFDGIPPTKVLLILEHMEANGSRYSIQRNMEIVIANSPKEHQEKIGMLLNITDIIRLVIPLYADTFSEEDLRQMNSFLKTPAGVKMIQATPELMKASIPVITEYFQDKLGGVLKL